MSNRWLRFGVALLALAAAGVAGFRIFQQEQHLTNSIATARSTDLAAETALTTVPEVKAALHAYVAEGQGHAFWTARAAMLLERLRASLLELDGPAAAAGTSLTEVLDLADRLGAAEKRARDHVRADQKLLAGEVIFTDTRDTLDAMRLQLVRTRTQFSESAIAAQDQIRRGQKLLAMGAFGILTFAMMLLVLPAGSGAAAVAVPKGPSVEVTDAFGSSARLVSRTPATSGTPSQPSKVAARSNGGSASPASSNGSSASTASAADRIPGKAATVARPATPAAGTGARSSETAAPGAPPVAGPPAAAAPVAPPLSLREAAAICTELGRASQSIEVSNLLARAAKVLDASGAVVWMASLDGRELYPAASTGYDERLLTRIGTIPRTANNVTAGAIRSGTPRASARSGQSAAALAVPLLTPLGAVGVLSAELKNVAEVDETRMAVATIFAAQLATLVSQRSAGAVATTAPTASQDGTRSR